MIDPTTERVQRRPGVMPYSFSGPAGSRQMRLIQDLGSGAIIRAGVIATNASPSLEGVRFGGTATEAYVSRASGLVGAYRGSLTQPKIVRISDVAPNGVHRGRRLWVSSEATVCDIPCAEGRRSVRVLAPISSLALDLTQLDLIAGVSVEAPPIAWNSLHGLVDMLAGDVDEWVVASAAAVDQYLIGVAGLILAAVLDSELDGSVDYDRARLRTRALALIEAQFQNPGLAPATIAANLGVSLRSLHRAFEGTMGVADELRSRRVNYATRLLSDFGLRRMPINEVARRAGFTSMATFGRSFARAHENSPHEFRRAAVEVARPPR
jgi:AraC-like DNA-binding protein